MNDWSRVLGRAVEATRNGVLITDPNRPDNPIVYANPAFERITGYATEEAIGRNCRFLQRFDRDQPELEEVRAAIREERDCRVVVRNYRKDGTLFWQELSISPVRDERGRLTHFVGVQDDVTERKLAEARVAHQAFHDPLTGLPNRLLFMDRLRDALSRAARGGGEMVAVFAVGLDGFRTFNETHGHDAGDRLLASAAERLEGCLRQEDAVARLGGDEFVILLDGVADTEAAIQFAKKVSEALRKPLLHEEGVPPVTASIGIVLSATRPEDGEPRDLLRRAETAMYRSKGERKATYKVFEPGGRGGEASPEMRGTERRR